MTNKVQQDKNSEKKRKSTRVGFNLIFWVNTSTVYSHETQQNDHGYEVMFWKRELPGTSFSATSEVKCPLEEISMASVAEIQVFEKWAGLFLLEKWTNQLRVAVSAQTDNVRIYDICIGGHICIALSVSFYVVEASVARILEMIFVFQATDTYFTNPIFSVMSLSGH